MFTGHQVSWIDAGSEVGYKADCKQWWFKSNTMAIIWKTVKCVPSASQKKAATRDERGR